MESTWATRDLPVLQKVVELYDAQLPSTMGVGPQQMVEETRLSRDEVDRAAFALMDSGLLSCRTDLRGGDRVRAYIATNVVANLVAGGIG